MAKGRVTININSDWKFFRGDEPKAWYKGFDDSSWQTVTLPHDWSVREPFSIEHSSGTGYLPGGTGWYRKGFFLPEESRGKKVYVTFEGVYNHSQVWCNSNYIGKRPYGYSTFTYDITDFISYGEMNILSVRVNHKDIADSRWFTGSGINRNVYLTVTGRIHIDQHGIFVTTPEVTPDRAVMSVDIRLSNETQSDADILVKNTLIAEGGETVGAAEGKGTIPPGAGAEINQTVKIANPELWSPDTPYLYSLVTEIREHGEVMDRVITPVGIRRFEFNADKGFFLNGINMKIKGVCLHHDAGCLGAAVPAKVWERRLRALKEAGCNAIRTSHNPPDPDLLGLCDRMGFLVMDEAFDEWEGVKNKWSTGHNVYPPKHFGYYEDFPDWSERDIKDMILRDRNHPSVILWSIGNEIDYPNDPYCHPYFRTMTGNNDDNKPAAEREYDPDKPDAGRLAVIAKRLAGYVKECDATRPVTAALAFPELSNLTGYADALDVVGYNYKESLYEEDHGKYPGRVILGSENRHTPEAWLAVRDNDHICSQFLWTGVDYLGEAKGWPVRANDSGLLDLAGFKKPRFYYRCAMWSREPVVSLLVRKKDRSSIREDAQASGKPCWNWTPGEALEVICWTNCEEAELFINDRSLGTVRLERSTLKPPVWDVDFEEGVLKAVAANGKAEACSCELVTSSEPRKIMIAADAGRLAADGKDVAHIEMTVADGSGRQVYRSDHLIELTVEGPGELLGIENGDVRDLEPYTSGKRKAYHGRLIAYVRAGSIPGRIVIKAESEGLESARTVIEAITD